MFQHMNLSVTVKSKNSAEKTEHHQGPESCSSSSFEIADPACDPNHPVIIDIKDIRKAFDYIKNTIIWTPCTKSNMSSIINCDIYFKKEFLQTTGSFKERGVYYLLKTLNEEERKKGLIAASAGNHSSALCFYGYSMNIPIVVVMPTNTALNKINQCKKYNATVILKGDNLLEAKTHGLQLAKTNNMIYVSGYDHPKIIAGQGTAGLEILKDVPDADAVIVPVGGGSLVAGISVVMKHHNPKCQIIAVESENCPSFSAAIKAGKQVYVQPLDDKTLADGLSVPVVGINSLETAKNNVDKVVTVKEEDIALAIYRLVQIEKAVVEGAGACGLAAILAGQLPELAGKKVVILLTGGNIDITVLNYCLEYGLIFENRIVKLQITLPRETNLSEPIEHVLKLGAKIRHVYCGDEYNAVFLTKEMSIVCETRDHDHCMELQRALKELYENITFVYTEKM
ncbi:L-threonine ammonia-lyase [Centruroides vittatus]|uniref:L-threonine ammonia-lyase n=1 Tax=Centruroides vittatus TaxID=120091 RepID=UPI0035107A0B